METGGEAAAGVQDRGLLGDLLEKAFSPGGDTQRWRGKEELWLFLKAGGRESAQQDQTPLDPPGMAEPEHPLPGMAHTGTNAMLSCPGSTHLSWPSLFLLFLLLRAILVLELFFRAGPILMEVFSRAVVLRATLFPL